MKPQCEAEAESRLKMPPTRGHDLKPDYLADVRKALGDAPHTGARLETHC